MEKSECNEPSAKIVMLKLRKLLVPLLSEAFGDKVKVERAVVKQLIDYFERGNKKKNIDERMFFYRTKLYEQSRREVENLEAVIKELKAEVALQKMEIARLKEQQVGGDAGGKRLIKVDSFKSVDYTLDVKALKLGVYTVIDYGKDAFRGVERYFITVKNKADETELKVRTGGQLTGYIDSRVERGKQFDFEVLGFKYNRGYRNNRDLKLK